MRDDELLTCDGSQFPSSQTLPAPTEENKIISYCKHHNVSLISVGLSQPDCFTPYSVIRCDRYSSGSSTCNLWLRVTSTIASSHRVPWCSVTHDAPGAEQGSCHHGRRASWREEKLSGAAQQHSWGSQQGQCGERTCTHDGCTENNMKYKYKIIKVHPDMIMEAKTVNVANNLILIHYKIRKIN